MNIAEVEAKLVAACEKAIADGWTIAPEVTVDDGHQCCCALGALWVGSARGIHPILFAKSVLGVPRLVDFVAGFDDACFGDTTSELYDLGARLRARYVKP